MKKLSKKIFDRIPDIFSFVYNKKRQRGVVNQVRNKGECVWIRSGNE